MISIVVDRVSPEPVYEQVARQIRDRIASGKLMPGSVLPSVRTLASDLGVNLNTVARAYRLLEEEGFLGIRERSGAVVLPPPSAPAAFASSLLRRDLREVLARMRQSGVHPDDLRRIVSREIDSLTEVKKPRGGS